MFRLGVVEWQTTRTGSTQSGGGDTGTDFLTVVVRARRQECADHQQLVMQSSSELVVTQELSTSLKSTAFTSSASSSWLHLFMELLLHHHSSLPDPSTHITKWMNFKFQLNHTTTEGGICSQFLQWSTNQNMKLKQIRTFNILVHYDKQCTNEHK